jgi:hypothetical protein
MLRSIAVAVVLASAGLAGCAHDYPTVGYAEVTSAPVRIDKYPSAMYKGRPTYLFEGKWYFRDGSQWRYFLEEPPPLRQARERIERGEYERPRAVPPAEGADMDQRRESREEREDREDRRLRP